jgi:acetyl esterase/lipase
MFAPTVEARPAGLRARALLLLMRSVVAPHLRRDASWAERRRNLDRAALPAPTGVRVERVAAPLDGEWLTPNGAAGGAPDGRVLLYLHGGGYCIGSCRSARDLAGRLARAARARAFVPEYRLAPEHRFPAALDDALAAFRGLTRAGVPARRIVAAGESAGGGLALALALALREAGEPLPGGVVAFSPWTDLGMGGDSVSSRAHRDPILTLAGEREAALAYLGGRNAREPLASPLFAGLAGLPPVSIHVGSEEILFDDSTRFAEKARAAGVEVSLRVWPGLWHNWQSLASVLPEARHAIEAAAEFVLALPPGA